MKIATLLTPLWPFQASHGYMQSGAKVPQILLN